MRIWALGFVREVAVAAALVLSVGAYTSCDSEDGDPATASEEGEPSLAEPGDEAADPAEGAAEGDESAEGEPASGEPEGGEPEGGEPEGGPITGIEDPDPAIPEPISRINGVPFPDSTCPYPQEGEQIGIQIGDLLQNNWYFDCNDNQCSGDDIATLWDVSCGSAMTWFFFTTQWCPYCRTTINGMKDVLDEYYHRGLRVAVINWQNNFGNPPTKADCGGYRQTYPNLQDGRVSWLCDQVNKSQPAYYTGAVVSLSIVVDRYGRILARNETTNPSAVAWDIREEFKRIAEEYGL